MAKWPLFHCLFLVKRLSSPASLLEEHFMSYAFKSGCLEVKIVKELNGQKQKQMLKNNPRKNLITTETLGREWVKGWCRWLFFLSPKLKRIAFQCSAAFIWDFDPESILLVVDVRWGISFSNNLDRLLFLLLVIVRIPMNRKISWQNQFASSPEYLLVYSSIHVPSMFKVLQ